MQERHIGISMIMDINEIFKSKNTDLVIWTFKKYVLSFILFYIRKRMYHNLVKNEYIFRENNTNVVSYFIYSNLKYYISHVLSLQLYTFICGGCQQWPYGENKQKLWSHMPFMHGLFNIERFSCNFTHQ